MAIGPTVNTPAELEQVNSLFDQPWWLEALAPDGWGAAVVEDGGIVARLPYAIHRTLGLTVLSQPPLTPALGPWLAASSGKYGRRIELELRRLRDLIDALPRFDVFVQQFAPAIDNWLPFYWAGFNATVRYSHRIDSVADLDAVWEGFDSTVRGHVRAASKEVEVRDDLGLDVFLDLNRATMERKQAPVAYTDAVVRRLDAACVERESREMLFAVDSAGRPQASIYVVWDSRSAFYLMSGRDHAVASRGVLSLLIWTAIQRAASRTVAFDFEGSMLEPIARHFRAFGARLIPLLRVAKVSPRARPLLAARHVLRAIARSGLG